VRDKIDLFFLNRIKYYISDVMEININDSDKIEIEIFELLKYTVVLKSF